MAITYLQQFIQQFRALLAIVILCIIAISSICVMTLTSEQQPALDLGRLDNLLTHLYAMTENISAEINNTIQAN